MEGKMGTTISITGESILDTFSLHFFGVEMMSDPGKRKPLLW
jgi:hypothetical protein